MPSLHRSRFSSALAHPYQLRFPLLLPLLLPLLRLSLIFIATCFVLAQLDLVQRLVRDHSTGLPSPLLPREPLPPPSTHPFLGINLAPASVAAGEQSVLFEELAAAGFGWVRVRVGWDQVESTEGNYEWQALDNTLAALAEAGLVPVLLLDGSPAWARVPEQSLLAPPTDPLTFTRFAQVVAMRYGEHVQFYQLWDEPNIAPHWGARHIEPVDYARLLKVASTAIREADADARILLAALAPTADRGHLAQDELYFLNRLYAAGAAPYFDAVAIEPFGFATRPDDPQVNRQALNFRRTLWIRQVMLDAGDGETPIWLMRYGWNRSPGSPWKSVSAQEQSAFAVAALEMAYRQWPWVAAMGWPIAISQADDPSAGFALTPELTGAFRTASATLFAEPRPRVTPIPQFALWMPVALWVLAVAFLFWRALAAARRLPWGRWQAKWVARPLWQQVGGWTLLVLIYYVAFWPPLILLCCVIAAIGFLAQPRVGLAIALFLLPFYAYHKEIDWLGHQWLIPPAQAVMLCLLPAVWHHRPQRLPRDRWLWVAVSWGMLMLVSAVNVWYWPAYWLGMLDLVVAPLFLFMLIRAWATTQQQSQFLVIALAAGGLFAATLGLIDWSLGGGTVADGLRRLTGPNFSSNHAALYFIRTLAIVVGLALASKGRARGQWSAWSLIAGIALFLTGSRGALLLGVPAGALLLMTRHKLTLPSRRWLVRGALVMGLGLVPLLWLWWDRLTNLGTLGARMQGWVVAVDLWLDYFLLGVGPEGFWWTFPAYMSLASRADPNLRHPHNLFLEYATSGGLLALVWLLATMVLVYHWLRSKNALLSWVQMGLLAGLVAGLAHAQMDAFQALPSLAGWNWAALALLLAFEERPHPRPPQVG